MAPLQLGVFVVPDAQEVERTLALVAAADAAGLDLVGVQDHPYQRRFLDTWTLLSFLAASTERIRLVTDVANLPLRPPAVLAKAAASLDVLSGGRVELGLGAGGFAEAIAAIGGPERSRKESVDALEEAIAVIRLMWSGERSASFAGEHYTLRGVHPGPQPLHPIGIWLGAYGPRMVRLTGRLADGWLPSVPRMPLEEVGVRQRWIDEAARAADRDPAAIVRLANVNGAITDGDRDGYLRGPAEQWIEQLSELRDRYRFDGFVFWGDGDPRDQLARFAEEVAPALRERFG
ncbi:LLM class flavin-dependent oxidoreductase [Conexibacter sp. CPCC 206217]|uniref:LLM class flavin-dependent oxidoreductase n=1 Tax=Conexibacter sp. CPCC 206217 TaxID=3064574 RepID=UPI002727737F|nr:LLM class flavin-dependent oxidoreductase [Conexibacter sp. CPCC 206217]MDO8210520.1 LLM class flavin-dependent oxidoreductase [Conexibacter sp. CPCC 206217]